MWIRVLCLLCACSLAPLLYVPSSSVLASFRSRPDPQGGDELACHSFSSLSASDQPPSTITSHSHVPMTFFQLDLTTEQHYQHHGYS